MDNGEFSCYSPPIRAFQPKGPTNFARMRTIVTAALQRQYFQTELILWIRHVFQCFKPVGPVDRPLLLLLKGEEASLLIRERCIFQLLQKFRLCARIDGQADKYQFRM
jgi:hypothetical protein